MFFESESLSLPSYAKMHFAAFRCTAARLVINLQACLHRLQITARIYLPAVLYLDNPAPFYPGNAKLEGERLAELNAALG